MSTKLTDLLLGKNRNFWHHRPGRNNQKKKKKKESSTTDWLYEDVLHFFSKKQSIEGDVSLSAPIANIEYQRVGACIESPFARPLLALVRKQPSKH